jgi:putative flippase GtrA
MRFAMVGVVNSVFGFGVFAGLQFAIGGLMHYLVILLIAHVVSVLEAYLLQRWLVFRVSGQWWRDLARFWSVYLVALAINLVALPLLVEMAHVSVLPAQAIIMLGTALGTFVAHRSFTFRRPRGPYDQPVTAQLDRAFDQPVATQIDRDSDQEILP